MLLKSQRTMVFALLAMSPLASGDTVERVSVANGGGDSDQGSGFMTLSSDGRFVAFVSDSSNLTATPDTNGFSDVFVRDRSSNTTTRISVGAGGVEGNGPSFCPVITPDGRYIAFSSVASNLVPSDTNGDFDIFLHDRDTGLNELVSISSGGVQGNGASFLATISADARFITYTSDGTNLDATPDLNSRDDVFLRDRLLQTTIRVSDGQGGVQGNDHSIFPIVSGDGRFIAYNSDASNLVAMDVNGLTDVFLYSVDTGETEIVSVSSGGAQANTGVFDIGINIISADGRYVIFSTAASNLVAGDTNGQFDVFVRDTVLDETRRVSVANDGSEADSGSEWAAISADGRYVVFDSGATNLVAGDTNGVFDVFVRDVANETTVRVSVDDSGAEGNSDSYAPTMSTDGRNIGFISDATNLVSGDANGSTDAFVATRCWNEFLSLGGGVAGAGGVVPNLSGGNGACAGGYSIGVDGALGGALGLLFIGSAELAQPLFGGTLHVGLATPFSVIAIPLSGPAGQVGAGSLTLPPVDTSSAAGQQLVLQMLMADVGAANGVSMTNGLRIAVVD